MRRGGKKFSNIFNRFYTFFSLFHTFFQIFRKFSHFLTVFKHELARLVLSHLAQTPPFNTPFLSFFKKHFELSVNFIYHISFA